MKMEKEMEMRTEMGSKTEMKTSMSMSKSEFKPESDPLNVIALISGGKDSLYSLLHCLENGHKIVALANLYPRARARSASASASHSHSHSPAHSQAKKEEKQEKENEQKEKKDVLLHEGLDGITKDEDQDHGEDEDLNSFMYQTVGYSMIPLYAECLGLPLYRRQITGSAVQTGRYYDTSSLSTATGIETNTETESESKTETETETEKSLDETEDLLPLLQEILHKHPAANALCSGAILSTYQRTRVESVAVRLGLTPLAYLWQYPALPPPVGRDDSLTGLLDDMAAAGCDARIIKIASGGIKESLLWSNVADADSRTRSRLVTGFRPFFPDREFWLRGAVLGEGGEYETLAINGPRRLWKKRIAMSEETSSSSSSTIVGDGGVSYVRLGRAMTVQNQPESTEQDEGSIRVPRAWDPQFEGVATKVQSMLSVSGPSASDRGDGLEHGSKPFPPAAMQLSQNLTSTCLTISNITAQPSTVVGVSVTDVSSTPTVQMQQICAKLNSLIDAIPAPSHGLGLPWKPTSSDIVFAALLLKDISHFGAINAVYSTLFRSGEPNPPARVTLACDLPAGIEVSLSVILDLRPRGSRRGLHVQSRSYWAPANIGPYSQAICVPLKAPQDSPVNVNVHDAELVEVVHVAGQIPLIPQSMQVLSGSFLEQAVLSLQHLWRVGQERGVDLWPWGVAFLQHDEDIPTRADQASKVWQQVNQIGTRPAKDTSTTDSSEDEDGLDAWDRAYNRGSTYEATVGEHLHVLPKPSAFKETSSGSRFVPPFIAAEVVSLPRAATVEWWSLGLANLLQLPGSVPRAYTSRRRYTWGSIGTISFQLRQQEQEQEQSLSRMTDTTIHLVTVLIHLPASLATSDAVDAETVERDVIDMFSSGPDQPALPPVEVAHGTAFISAADQDQTQWCKQALFANLTVVPCKSVYGSAGLTTSDLAWEGEGEGEEEKDEYQSGEDLQSTLKAKRASKKLKAEETWCTGMQNDAAPSCQPLAAALTLSLRVEHGSQSSRFGSG
ncbi:hypothetical protein A1O3_08786 [Capronia epimyces CBS 606.96]|uniref:Diphthine--ammonia ligase n=1 Tax=Capronia epimyces CBS 606.96 TaxID=1182542 RepID=W9YA78_9EURO|nr:uncharacterized protein A1O3_08786 [Capronia epimyces CBS 606.96]EXJ79284.1 hypothetical protein A1O3_08786 [Capronia epimyces CBS 606.96]